MAFPPWLLDLAQPNNAGAAGLAMLAFLAGTLLPLSSEAALFGALRWGMDPWRALISASAGNALAVLANYYLGRLLAGPSRRALIRKHFGRMALRFARRYGLLAMFASWLPIIGDPLTVAAGIFRLRPAWFVPIACGCRVARYAVIVYATVS